MLLNILIYFFRLRNLCQDKNIKLKLKHENAKFDNIANFYNYGKT